MPSLTHLATLLAAASLTEAHHVFFRIAHNGVWQAPLEYIRNRTSPFEEIDAPGYSTTREWIFPYFTTDYANSQRCGRDNLAWANQTSVLKVKAGDKVEFASTIHSPNRWDKEVKFDNCPDGRGICNPDGSDYIGITHDGPSVMHLSRVPEGQDVHTYDGSGEWVKIGSVGMEVRSDQYDTWLYWLPNHGKRITTTIPKQTPAGRYLLRVDIVQPSNEPQFYPSCVQIEVESEATGQLPEGVKIPEAWSKTSEGMSIPWVSSFNETYKAYVNPGGKLWDGEKTVVDHAVEYVWYG